MTWDSRAAARRFAELSAEAGELHSRLYGSGGACVMVGTASCGRAAGALEVEQAFREEIAAAGVSTEVFSVGCLGHCYAEPMAVVKRQGEPALVYHHLNPQLARALVREYLAGGGDPLYEYLLGALEQNEKYPALSDLPRFGKETRFLLRRAGLYLPSSALQAIALGAWRGLVRAMELGAEKTIGVIEEAGLRGLGGAGFPTARKWRTAASQPEKTRYIICNADEGDPGAYMDRTLLESDPHAVLEGLAIGGLAIGATQGFLYIRAEYPLAVERVRDAIEDARASGLLGDDILGSGFDFHLQVIRGAGAFVCGEETAMIESMEGRRGMPRLRPPYPAQRGLRGKPTVINNVKTLAAAAHILAEGAERFASLGRGRSRGTALFALAGKVANAGLVEVPMGATLRQVIFDLCGGVAGGKSLRAVQIGGPSGGCLPESLLDTPIDFESLQQAGAMMGSGGMVVLDQDNCLVETARFFLEFTQKESCGKCTFCRIGTGQMLDILERLVKGQGTLADLDRLERLALDIKRGSLCNLGRTAPNPVLSSLRYFRDEFVEHITQKRCRARVCEALSAYYILPEKCARGCDACVGSCPVQAIFTSPSRRIKVIDQTLCTKCDSCRAACPPEYDAVVRISPLSELPPSEPRPEKSAAGEP